MIAITIQNQGFDGPFRPVNNDSHLKVAHGWGLRWEEGPYARQGFLVRPECYPKELTREDYCQGIQTTHATHQAALVQVVAVPELAKGLTLSAHVAYYAPEGGMAVRVGLDSSGQTLNMNAPTIQWGSWLNQDGDPPWEGSKFVLASTRLVEPTSGYISIWLWSQNRWRGRNNHVFWKDVSLEMDDEGTPPDPASAAVLIMQAVDILLDAVGQL